MSKEKEKEELLEFWETCRDASNNLLDEADILEAKASELLLKSRRKRKTAKGIREAGQRSKDKAYKLEEGGKNGKSNF